MYARSGERWRGGKGTRRRTVFMSGEFLVWSNMVRRCTDSRIPKWSDYGGRGIRVCERWLIFKNWLADMGPRPKGFQLERKNNDGNYEPENCLWIPAEHQARNRRTSLCNLTGTPDTRFTDPCAVDAVTF